VGENHSPVAASTHVDIVSGQDVQLPNPLQLSHYADPGGAANSTSDSNPIRKTALEPEPIRGRL
jgi:hypothetical protein